VFDPISTMSVFDVSRLSECTLTNHQAAWFQSEQ